MPRAAGRRRAAAKTNQQQDAVAGLGQGLAAQRRHAPPKSLDSTAKMGRSVMINFKLYQHNYSSV
jgi:hypothetical protein